MSRSDDLILKIEVSEDSSYLILTVYTESGRSISSNDFITEIEMWLHEITQAEILKQNPGTSIH